MALVIVAMCYILSVVSFRGGGGGGGGGGEGEEGRKGGGVERKECAERQWG